MSELFLTVLDMSLTASYAILIVLLARQLLKKAPKVISYALWSVVAFRLTVPFSFESVFSLMPRKTNAFPIPADIVYQPSPQISSGTEAVDAFVRQTSLVPAVGASGNPLQIYVEIGAYVWLFGLLMLLAYSLISVFHLKRQLQSAQAIGQNIFQAEKLQTPFVLGFIKPKIYLPVGLNSEERSYILLHEQIHIQRKDHIIKVLAFLILCVHWFNPLVWLGFRLMSTDMELSCDEKVLKLVNADIKKSYANSLLSLAAGRHILNGSPLAFGEGNVKRRIINVLNYKKPKFWVIILAIVFVLIIGLGLAANPKSVASFNGSSYRVQKILYEAPIYSFSYTLDTAPEFCISADFVLYSKQPSAEDWVMHGGLNPYKISSRELYDLFIPPVGNIQEIINQTELVYRVAIDDDPKTFYMVLQLKNGDVLLAVGYDYDKRDFRHIRWLFKLERIGEEDEEAAEMNSVAQGSGDGNSESSGKDLLQAMNESEISELVEKNLAVIMSSPKEASNSDAYIRAHQQEYENIIKFGGEKALQYMLSQFASGKADGLRGQIMMRLCKELLGARNNVNDETLTPQEWYQALAIRQEVKLPDFQYEGNDPIEKLVYATEIAMNSQPLGGFTIVAPKIFGSYEEGDLLKVFVTTYSATYKLYGNELEQVGGSIVPSAITYKKDSNGNYLLEKYEQAKDGAYWLPSIKEFCTMPVSGKKIPGLADRIIDHYGKRDDIHTLHYDNLFKHLKANGIKEATLYDPYGEIEFSMSKPEYVN